MNSLSTLKKHRAFLILIAFAASLFISDIWAYREFVRAESYFALGALSMVERGEWLTPHAPDELQLNKPPLTYWLIGVSYKLFGVRYGAARLPSVVAALGVLAIVYLLGAWLGGNRSGLISAAILGFSYLFFSFARLAMSDMVLTLCVTAAFACFVVALTAQTAQPSKRASKLALLGYVAIALGVLAKGPVALVIVSFAIGLELLLRRGRGTFAQLRLHYGVAIFLLFAVPYFLFVYLHVGGGPLRFFLVGENLQRFTGQIYGGGARPFWYEPAAFFSDFAPWSPLLFLAAWFDWRRPDQNETVRRQRRMLYFWLGGTVLLFSLANFKRDYYLLPAMPAAALIIGPWIANGERLPALARRIIAGVLGLSSLVVLAAALFSLRAAAVLSAQTPLRFLPMALALAGTVLVFAQLARKKIWQASLILMTAVWVTILTMQLTLLPAFSRYLPAAHLAASIPAGRVIFSSSAANDWASSIAFNLPAPHLIERLIGDQDNQKLLESLRSDPRALAIMSEREYAIAIERDSALKILAEAETFSHGGLSLNMLRHPERQRLLLVGH